MKEVNFSLFGDDMIFCVENPKEFTENKTKQLEV